MDHFSREETLVALCRIAALVYHSQGDYTRPSDGFCRDCPAGQNPEFEYRNDGHVLRFILDAVKTHLMNRGYRLHGGTLMELGYLERRSLWRQDGDHHRNTVYHNAQFQALMDSAFGVQWRGWPFKEVRRYAKSFNFMGLMSSKGGAEGLRDLLRAYPRNEG